MAKTAAVLVGGGRVDFREVEPPEPGDGELVVRCRANAICGSDRGAFAGGAEVVQGHEAAGEVIAAGAGTSTAVGTRGVVYLMVFCGECRSCRAGATNVCLAKQGDMGFNRAGGLGPYEVVDERVFFAVDERVPFATATALLDLMGTSGHALDRALLLRPGIEDLYVAGVGPVGLGVLLMAKLRFGADFPVYVSDPSPWRLDFAAGLGAMPVQPEDLPLVDAAVDASGRSEARQAAVRKLGRRGVLVCVGHGQGLELEVSPDLVANEAGVIGSEYFPYADLATNHEILLANLDEVSRVITHTFDLSETQAAFEAFLGGETGKVVVTQDA
ncbi:alcohol dehydrogenase catalytic domain-containing protein [Kribbella italica]|uniref:Threonine dehydrogenase-like Zn-dependent dehydrogenase n=1 Tax=Kribbella italica TaxID=1540520 RepID=A0A7W9JFW1_9ACTN|nr:alcohol dehydrogenase catalytic domain-containing protein [Kribbella italica]MBB5840763.1 threonine dehydrogenase-like Zn-dependent dehydrogenase [Kribbella italica]